MEKSEEWPFSLSRFFPLFKFRKRAREEEIEAAEKAKRDREWQKNFEVGILSSAATTLDEN